MKLKTLALALVLALPLGGCSVFQDLAAGDITGAAASVGDTLVTPSVHAAVANSALGAENIYTGAQKILTAALKNHGITKVQGNTLDPYVDKVYAIVVKLRAVQQGQDVTVLLQSFNGAFGDLFTAAKSVGVTLPTQVPTGDAQ